MEGIIRRNSLFEDTKLDIVWGSIIQSLYIDSLIEFKPFSNSISVSIRIETLVKQQRLPNIKGSSKK